MLATTQLIAVTEVMLGGGHNGTKTRSTMACRLACSSVVESHARVSSLN
jgi:hypothetical protein